VVLETGTSRKVRAGNGREVKGGDPLTEKGGNSQVGESRAAKRGQQIAGGGSRRRPLRGWQRIADG
jgi:hypothetical protein